MDPDWPEVVRRGSVFDTQGGNWCSEGSKYERFHEWDEPAGV